MIRILGFASSKFSKSFSTAITPVQRHGLLAAACQTNSLQQNRFMSGKKSFLSEFIDNVRQEMSKNKEMKESLQRFREEAEKLEQSDALKKAREKYDSIEKETARSSQVLKEQLEGLKDTLEQTMKHAQESEMGKKGQRLTEDLAKTVEKAKETIKEGSEQVTKSVGYKTFEQSVKAVKGEIDDITLSRTRVYKAPSTLKTRKELSTFAQEQKVFEADSESTGITLHKDSKWYQQWENFRNNNQYMHKIFDMKTRFDESEHGIARGTRFVTEKMSQLFGGLFQRTEMSEVLTEITRIDPTFEVERFCRVCETVIIPNILEAMLRGNLDILEDWCSEAPYNTLAQPIKTAQSMGYLCASRVLDIAHVDVLVGQIMDQGPVLVIQFIAQQIMAVTDKSGKVVEGDSEKILRYMHRWALCRDQSNLDPIAAWKLIDLSCSPSEQFV